MQCCWRSFLKMESFSFIQELTVLFEVRFKIFSEKKKKKSRKLQKLLWLLQKSVISLNLEYLVRSMAPENHKNHKLICLLIFTLCWQIVKEKKCILSSPWMYHVWTFIFRMKHFSITFYKPEPEPDTSSRKNWAFSYWTLVEKHYLYFFWIPSLKLVFSLRTLYL